MKIRDQLEQTLGRFTELESMMSDPTVLTGDSSRMAKIMKEHGGLLKVATKYRNYKRMGDELRKEISKSTGDLSLALETVFAKIDNECRIIDAENCGSTACVAVVKQENGLKVVYVANIGDTRAVMSNNGIAVRLSYDHRATDPAEIERVKSLGGTVIDGRVGGSLALTRAFGDHSL